MGGLFSRLDGTADIHETLKQVEPEGCPERCGKRAGDDAKNVEQSNSNTGVESQRFIGPTDGQTQILESIQILAVLLGGLGNVGTGTPTEFVALASATFGPGPGLTASPSLPEAPASPVDVPVGGPLFPTVLSKGLTATLASALSAGLSVGFNTAWTGLAVLL